MRSASVSRPSSVSSAAGNGATRAILVAMLIAMAVVITAGVALAQCPMCGQAAEQAGTGPGAARRAFLVGVLFLLLPALSVIGGIAAVVIRQHKAEAGEKR